MVAFVELEFDSSCKDGGLGSIMKEKIQDAKRIEINKIIKICRFNVGKVITA
jgi:hypothetical protein